MKKTYGELALTNDKWEMTGLPPHVAIRLKHLFPRIPKWQTERFTFPNDMTHCADLSWFLSRYPMEMSESDRKALDGERERFERTQDRMEEILRPDYKPPARIGLRDGQHIRHYHP